MYENNCKICQNGQGNILVVVDEWMGSKKYNYLQCGHCGSLQFIDEIPDFYEYYDNESYASFQESNGSMTRRTRQYLGAARDRLYFTKLRGVLKLFPLSLFPVSFYLSCIGQYANFDSEILDVGCGNGKFLRRLSKIGFRHLKGIDPYLSKNMEYPDGVTISRLYIEQEPGTYDTILSYNSFEHIPNPIESTVSMKEHLKENGVILISMPILGELYQMYREYDFVIQAPQHPFLHTVKSMKIVALKAGLTLEKVLYDSPDTTRLDWMKYSELYSRGMRHREIIGDINKYFDKDDIKLLQNKLAKSKLDGNKGDNAIFVLRNI